MAKKPQQPGQGSDVLMATSFTMEPGIEEKKVGCFKESPKDHEEVPPKLPPRALRPSSLASSNSMTFDPQLRSDMMALKTDNEELRRQTSNLEVELGQMSEQMGTVMKEKENLMKKVLELQQRIQSYSSAASPSQSRVVTPTKHTSTPPPHIDRRSVESEVYPVAKMAELKKLKTCASDMQVLGSEVAMLGVQSTPTAEHLVQSLNDGSSVAELIKTVSRGGGAHLGEAVVKEFEVELERRQAKIDHLKAQNDVLTATLEESKSHAERLSVLIGKYESNNTALQLAAVFSDHCMEAQDVLTALLDTEMGVLLANCRAAGLGGLGEGDDDQEEITAILQRAHHARRRAEGVARHLLTRLDRNNHMTVGSCHPWEDLSTNSRTASTSSTSSSGDIDFSKADEVRLRDHIQQLKSERAAVRTTVLELESVHVDPVTNEPRRRIEAQRLDLENAVLVQELMAVKEEKAELKARSYLLEKEKRALELRLSGKETQEQAFRVQIDYLKGELSYQQQGSQSLGLTGIGFLAEIKSREPCELIQDLTVSMEREHTLKNRVSELMSTLEKISRNSESRHKQSAEFVNDLKRANSALIAAFDKAKKKYQGRLKKMEGQLKNLRDKYEMETTALRQRLTTLETRGARTMPSETSL
ncbi:unnamed protein product [Lymnaea stagnalis]|uniref:Harmonin-binding protein USHBP1 PDZ-binding domain-containing protein n=1 Tax=Lymnaea stagnalis TaxID=6523 RepID=A0AAV2IMA7_LYMST